MRAITAAEQGFALCEVCGRLGKMAEHARCPRCNAPLHRRKPHSLERSWALLIAAYVLYLPANLLPIMETRSLFGVQRDTIMSGVAFPRFKSIQRMPGFGFKGHGDGWRFTPSIGQRKGEECWKHGTLRLQGVGLIKARGMARTMGKIKACELLHRHGEWHLSLTIECDPVRVGGSKVQAADWGTEKLLSLIDANEVTRTIDNPRWFKSHERRQIALDQAVSRKKRGSRGWYRAKRASAQFKARIGRKRLDHHH